MSNLKTVLTDIQDEKNTKLIPNNIKAGVTIMGVTGTYDGGGGGEETPAFVEFEGDNYSILVCNYGGWSDTYVHAKLDQYLTSEVVDAIYTFYDLDPSDPAGFQDAMDNIGAENISAIMHAMCVNLGEDPNFQEDDQYFSQFFVESGSSDYSFELDAINMVVTSSVSMDIRIYGYYSTDVTLETDNETGDVSVVVGEIWNMSVDTYTDVTAVPTDVANGKTFVARGQYLEGTATQIPSASIVLHSDNGTIYCDDETAVNALYDIKNNHFAEPFTLAIGMNSIKYTYVATFANHYDVSTGDDIPLLITFNADLENKTARYSFQEDEPEQTHKLELTNIEFDIEIYA